MVYAHKSNFTTGVVRKISWRLWVAEDRYSQKMRLNSIMLKAHYIHQIAWVTMVMVTYFMSQG